MKTNTRFWFSPLLLGLVFAILTLGGCSGDDGAPGRDGVDGQDGADAVILADIIPINPILDLSNTISYDQVSGRVTIHFFLTDEDGNGIDVTTNAYELRVYASELIANADGTNGQSWNQLWNERGTPAAEDPDDRLPGVLTLVDAATGEYTYVTEATLPASPNVQRVTMRARWRETINGVRWVFANPVNTSYDFLQADPGTELAASGADMVTTAACETCHGARIGDVGHGGGYTQTKTCNHCHNASYMATRNGGEGDLAFMIHRIHNAGVFPQLEGGVDFSHVTYPQHINTCAKCHNGPNADVAFDDFTTVITRANCGSCHDNVDFTTGDGHGTLGGIRLDDTECDTCHQGDNTAVGTEPDSLGKTVALGPVNAHDEARLVARDAPQNVPEYAVTIDMTPPANGTHYVAGEAPVVTVTLSGGAVAVNYLAAPEEGTTDGAMAVANLYVYGPRAEAIPVLATDTIHDPGYVAPPTQGHSMLSTSADPQLRTDATGFKYQLLPIPADMEPGTYMVRFEGEDYGTPGAPAVPEYWTASSAVSNIQIGQAEETAKVSGDACTNCHGDTIMHLEGAHPHHQPFDTDGCLGCHDKSGNYGDYIGNRAHAVHAASTTGDLFAFGARDWSHITFPQDVNNCTICHTDTTTDTPVWRTPDEVACGGCHGADPDVVPADWPDVDPDRILREAAAAQHMATMGGDFDATTPPTLQCTVCHGEGQIADLYDTHELYLFPPPPPPEEP
jgi:OmcA/MtrC family decaheme c-type cytochrome